MTAEPLIQPLSAQACLRLAALLPDEPQTVISRARLRQGTARAYAAGLTSLGFTAAIVEDPGAPGEPMVFGGNAEQIAALLSQIPNWFCVNAHTEIASKLAPLLAERLRCSIRQLGDLYHTLNQPPPPPLLANPAVRLLKPDDLPLLLAAPPEIRGIKPERLLRETAAAAAIIDGQLVALAQTYALTEKYGDIGVFTLPQWRGQGLASAAAAQVATWLQANGRIPVWSCGEHNQASLRVAQKLGFVENGRRVYIILQMEQEASL